MEYEWTDARVLELLDEIRELPCLWDVRDPDKKSRNKKDDCYAYLGTRFGTSADIVKGKFANLLQSYRAYKRRERRSRLAGEQYTPTWFAYEYVDEFMAAVYTPHGTAVDGADGADDARAEDDGSSTEVECDAAKRRRRPDDGRADKRQRHRPAADDDDGGGGGGADECSIFGQLVTSKLVKLDETTRQFVMNDISNLMFRAAIRNTSYYNEHSLVQTTRQPPEPLSP